MKINPEETNIIEFEITVKGINRYNLKGYIRIMIDKVELGFPVEIGSTVMKIEIPPLTNLLNRELSNGEKFPVRLDIDGDDKHLVPWKSEIEIEIPLEVDVKFKEEISNDSTESDELVSFDVVSYEVKPVIEEVIKEDVESNDKNSTERIMEKVLREDTDNKKSIKSDTLSSKLMLKLGL